MIFAETVKKIRDDHGYTQNDLAKGLGLAHSSISSVERGIAHSQTKTAHKVARLELFTESERNLLKDIIKSERKESIELRYVSAIEFGKLIRRLRKNRKMTLAEFRSVIGVNSSILSETENGKTDRDSVIYERIANCERLEPYERMHLREALKKVKDKNYDHYITVNEQRGHHPTRGETRIPSIPNFYKELHSICNEEGNLSDVDVNHPVLQSLRVKLGGNRVFENNIEEKEVTTK